MFAGQQGAVGLRIDILITQMHRGLRYVSY